VWLTVFSLRNPIVVTLFYVFVGIVGLVAFQSMGRSILPPIAFPVVAIAAPYPGAGPEEIERLVVVPIEEKLDAIPDLDRVSALAQNGIARIVVRFRFGGNLETDRSNAQQAVDAARANLPGDLLSPSVSELDPSQAPVMDLAVESAVLSPRELADALDNRILPALRASSGVGSVSVEGGPSRQFIVVPRLGALDATGVSALDVFRTLVAANDVLPGGRLRSPRVESSIGIKSAAEDAAGLRSLPVGANGSAGVRVGDVAGVVDGFADPATLVRVDGEPAVMIYVSRAENADALSAVASAQRTLVRLAAADPLIRFRTLRTDAPKTNAAIAGVLQTLGEGTVLTVLVMLVFLHAWRSAAIAAISIPASVLATLVAMWAAGFTVDVLSLMGLSLTVGILVDDSIVIVEAIARNAGRGLHGDEAALAGRRELGGAAIAITLVDVAVFAPIAFMSGIVGAFMREFGLVVVFATSFSLLVSFTLTPLLAARWALTKDGVEDPKTLPWMLRTRVALGLASRWHAFLNALADFEARTARAYASRWLPAALRRSRLVFAVAAAATVLSLVPVATGAIGAEFSPPVERGEATVDVTFPAGTPLERSDATLQRFSQRLLDDPAIGHVVAVAGRGFNGSSDTSASNLAQLTAVMEDPSASGDTIVDRVKSLQPLAPDAHVAGSGRGMGGTAPIDYTIAGDRQSVDAAARRIADVLESNPFATDVRLSDAGLAPRLEIDIDPNKAVLLGVAPDDAAQTARIATGGVIASRLRLRAGLTDVLVRSDAAERGDLDGVLRSSVRDGRGRLVPLSDLAEVRRGFEPAVVERENGERVVSVTANALPGIPIGRVTMPLARAMRQPGFLPAGARVQPRGDVEQLLDTMRKMGEALALAVVTVYGILAVLYRSYRLPFIVMTTVPLASIGAFGALYAFGQPLNLYSMLGIVMLVGLVSKNGILLVEYAQRAVRDGQPALAAMQAAAQRRFRPIVMTTAAMIAGMLPLALGHNIGAEYRQAMGTVVIGGLLSSLLLTLFVVPLAFVRSQTPKNSKIPRTLTRLEAPIPTHSESLSHRSG
jgi:hydrophobic/amphiphilic exporter-1 (mainly G- bacteria), HAE1 family